MNAWRTVFCFVHVLIKISCHNTVKTIDEKNYRIPNVTTTIRALYPKGLRVYISVDVEAKFLLFDGIIHNDRATINTERDLGQVWGVATKQAHGDWLFENNNVTLKVGQAINYGIFTTDLDPKGSSEDDYDEGHVRASLNFKGVATEYKIFDVTVLEDPLAPEPSCLATATKIRGRRACAGEVIFEDNFDTLREDLWQIEHYIPTDHPEYPFLSYQRLTLDPNVFIDNGTLHILPKLQEDLLTTTNDSIISGTLDLTNGCTRAKCFKVAVGSDILPPIVSGRLTSSVFAFTYGTVYVRAKLPQGDWLYPEILLEPLFKKYKDQRDLLNILKVAMADGNREGNHDTFGNEMLEGGPIMDESCVLYQTTHRKFPVVFWSDDFHEYVLRWTPDLITLSVDGDEYHRRSPTDMESSFRCLENFISSYHDYLHITLGVAVGGIREFPDSAQTKPWCNGCSKAPLQFWQGRESWLPTWTRPGLIVDYIKIVAL